MAGFSIEAPRRRRHSVYAIQFPEVSVRFPEVSCGVSPTTVQKSCERMPGRPQGAALTVFTPEKAIIVAFRRHTLLPLYDGLQGLQPSLERHGTGQRTEIDGDKPKRHRFANDVIGYIHTELSQDWNG